MKKILVINGHPDKESYNYALSQAYLNGIAMTSHEVDTLSIADLEFDPVLKYGYRKRMELEPDLKVAIEQIKQADHLVWFFPMWWYGSPALMKGFVDRAFLPGITYQPIEEKPFPKKLLKGKSARIVITSDTPGWYDSLVMRRPTINQFKKGTLEFCGVKPVKTTYIAPIKDSSDSFREKWLKKLYEIGVNQK